jgi:hypothetical protein
MLLALAKALDEMRPARFPMWTNRNVGVDEVKSALARWCRHVIDAIASRRPCDAPVLAYHGQALGTVSKAGNLLRGSCLYLDPAWPFADGSTAASFYYHPARVGEIVAQQETPFEFLEPVQHLHYVANLLLFFFNRGGRRALVATQSTNWPPPEELRDRLLELVPARVLAEERRDVEGGVRRTGFHELMLVLEAP